MIYRCGRYLFRFAVRQFFHRIQVSGAEPLEQGPVLFVCNHPNYFLDALLVLTVLQRELWFLAKATLFSTSFLRWLLKECHLVPVYRPQDNPGEVSKNQETFAFAAQTLQRSRGLVIFPEGVSRGERRLAPIKSGAARMSLQAEAHGDFTVGVQIQAVGITYSDLSSFKSSVTLTFGEPIPVSILRDTYHADAIQAVHELTEQVEEALRKVTVEVPSINHERLVELIGKLYEARGSKLDVRERLEIIARNVERVAPQFPEKHRELEERLSVYFELSNLFLITPGETLDRSVPQKVSDTVFEYLVIPFALLGAMLNYMPYRIIGSLVTRTAKYPVEVASKKLTWGLIVFPLWWASLGVALIVSGSGYRCGLLVAMLAAGSAYLANRYLSLVRLLLLSKLWPGPKKPMSVLRLMRDGLIEELERLRNA